MSAGALKRSGYTRRLVKRRLTKQAVILRSSTDSNNAVDHAPFAILPCTYEDEVRAEGRRAEGNQQLPTIYVLVLFEYNVDLRSSDRVVLGATNIAAGPPITYAGGETLEITGLNDLTADRVYVSARCLRKANKKPR